MAQVGTLTVDLIAQTASFNSNIEKAAKNLNSQSAKMNRSLSAVQKNIAAMRAEAEGLALGLAIREAATFVKSQLDLVGGLGEVAQQLGVTTRDLQVYRAIGGQVGVTQEDIDKSLSKLTVTLGQAALGAKGQGEAFAALGISVRDSAGHVKTAGQAIPEIADALAKIPDPAQRAAMEIALLGRSGQKMDTVLTEGSKGIAAYAKNAEDAGLVIADSLVKSADVAADKIDELNRQLSVNVSTAVAKNAESIVGLADALMQVSTAGINFVNNYPRLSSALMGAWLGSRAGPWGAAAGAVVGAAMGDSIVQSQNDSNMDLGFRRGRLNDALRNYNNAKRVAGSPDYYAPLEKELRRQTALTRKAIEEVTGGKKKDAANPVVNLPAFKGPGGTGGGGGRGRSGGGASPRDDAARNAQLFADQLSGVNMDLLRAKRGNLVDVNALAAIDYERLKIEAAQFDASVDAEVAAKRYTAAQADQLKAINQQVLAQQMLTVTSEVMERQARDTLTIQLAANDNERDMLSAQVSLATTAAERRPLQLRLLDLEKQEEKLKLEALIASRQSTEAEKQIAQARLASLDAIYGAKEEGAKKATQGPLQDYLDTIPKTAAEMDEALQGVSARGLQSLNDGIVDAIMGAKSLGDAFKAVANQIIADLLRIMVQKMIVDTIGQVMGIPGFAAGTFNAPAGLALVGERGPELVRFRGGEQVIPNHRLTGMNYNGRGAGAAGNSITVNVSGPMSRDQTRETGNQIATSLQRRMASATRKGIAA